MIGLIGKIICKNTIFLLIGKLILFFSIFAMEIIAINNVELLEKKCVIK